MPNFKNKAARQDYLLKEEIEQGGGITVAWDEVTEKPTTFPSDWESVENKPAIIAAGATQAAARTAIGAGTSNLAVGNTAGAAPGTASAGTATTAARSDHVHPLQTSVSGNAGTATALATGRTIGVSGGATGTSPAFNGSANVTIPITLATPTETVRGGVLQQAAIADLTAAPTMEDINTILAALRASGLIASA